MNRKSICFLSVALFFGSFIHPCLLHGQDELARSFAHPPASARPWVYWMWMDGNLSREGITADLEAMKRAGIGGVIIMEVNVGIPQGPVKFMGPEWRKLFKHVAAEAARLGLQIDLNASPGWTGSGGPWIKPEQSMQKIVCSDTNIIGPQRFERPLAQPETKQGFYRDVALLAFPKEAGSYRIADLAEKALYHRGHYSSEKGVRPSFVGGAEYSNLPPDQTIKLASIVDLSAKLDEKGILRWDVPAGEWTVLRFGRTSTGANTRPAPEPGLGLECDKLDKAALDAHFHAFIGTLMGDIGALTGKSLVSLHIDSWEMGPQNWTARFREEFRRLRGYDPLLWLPVMTGRVLENLEHSERFLWDVRQTVQDLIVENHARHLKALAHQHGMGLSIEPYDGTPCDDLTLGAVADVPMCEFWLIGFDTSFSCIQAASIAHTYGQRVVAAEAFTSSDVERWKAHPGSMKAMGDWAFCAGINRFVFHRYQHQPWLNRWPGMTMGPYGVHHERTQTWWEKSWAYHAYLARCQFMLQQGLAVADICYLSPEGAPNVFHPPTSATRGAPPDRLGYNFDGCTSEALLTRMGVKDGKLVMPDGMSYRVLVLPERETMTPQLLRKIKELVQGGATVMGPRPKKSPSLSDFPNCDREVAELAEQLWGSEARWGKAKASTPAAEDYVGYEIVAGVLKSLGVPPDFESDAQLRYTHHREGDTDIYFVANPEDRSLMANCTFRVSGKQPDLWDPLTGETRSLAEFTSREGLTSVPLRFEPAQSFFVVFRKAARTNTEIAGRNFSALRNIAELNGPWEVAFDPKWGGPDKITFEKLEDWTTRPEAGIRYYSGTAAYRKHFSAPELPKTKRLYLHLGTVKNMAQVRLNGRDLGVVWCAPWRVEITGKLKAKNNRLEIEVVNLWPNRLIGDEQFPPDCEYVGDGNLARWPEWLLKNQPRPSQGRYTFTTWKHFSKNTPLLPSGLLGPVTLTLEAE